MSPVLHSVSHSAGFQPSYYSTADHYIVELTSSHAISTNIQQLLDMISRPQYWAPCLSVVLFIYIHMHKGSLKLRNGGKHTFNEISQDALEDGKKQADRFLIDKKLLFKIEWQEPCDAYEIWATRI